MTAQFEIIRAALESDTQPLGTQGQTPGRRQSWLKTRDTTDHVAPVELAEGARQATISSVDGPRRKCDSILMQVSFAERRRQTSGGRLM